MMLVSANAPEAPNKPPPNPIEKKLTFFFPKSMKSYSPNTDYLERTSIQDRQQQNSQS
jgi:hypothetical protein